MKTLSVDISTITGFAYFEKQKLIDYGVINIQKQVNRLSAFFNKTYYLLKTLQPDVILIEDLNCMLNKKVVKILFNLQGVFELVIERYLETRLTDIVLEYINRNTYYSYIIKEYNKEKKKLDKIILLNTINNIYSKTFTSDEADAIAMGLFYLHSNEQEGILK